MGNIWMSIRWQKNLLWWINKILNWKIEKPFCTNTEQDFVTLMTFLIKDCRQTPQYRCATLEEIWQSPGQLRKLYLFCIKIQNYCIIFNTRHPLLRSGLESHLQLTTAAVLIKYMDVQLCSFLCSTEWWHFYQACLSKSQTSVWQMLHIKEQCGFCVALSIPCQN